MSTIHTNTPQVSEDTMTTPDGTTPNTNAVPATMRAIVQHRYGGPDTLELADCPTPQPGAGEVLVQVEAAGVDRGVWHLMAGLPLLVRPAFGLRRPRTETPGFDVAGTVVAIGDGVDAFGVGDEVMGVGASTFATYAVAPVEKLVPKPPTLTWAEAAGATISGITALEALDALAEVASGDSVLVLGASGGVGSFAVQIAVARGAEVVGVASAAKADFVRSLGAGVVLDYRAGSIAELADPHGPFDSIIDCGGLNSISSLRSLLTDTGTLVIVGGEGGGRVTGGFGRSILAGLISSFVDQNMPFLISKEEPQFIEGLQRLLASGEVKTPVWKTYPLADASTALADLEAGRVEGKVVLDCSV